MNSELKQFHELEEGKVYRLLHGGERDHGYNYELRNGVLYNKDGRRNSSVPFNNKVRFIEHIIEHFNLDSLEYVVEMMPRFAKIGCQTVLKKDLRKFYHKLGEFYGF